MSEISRTALLVPVLVYVFLRTIGGTITTNFQQSSQFHQDLRFLVRGNTLKVIKILTDLKVKAKVTCGRSCGYDERCQAFNIFKTSTAYTCELLPANTQVNSTRVAYYYYNGADVWEKSTGNVAKSFIEQKLQGVAPENYCETVRPGCRGVWPRCDDCVKSCIDCHLRYNYSGLFTCTMWPGPTLLDNTPITTTCYNKITHLMKRSVNLTNGKIIQQYRMPFQDINRLMQLNVYSVIQFSFFNGNGVWYQALYNNPYITENGTLMNLTFISSSPPYSDGLKLGSGTLAPTPFVTVTDDKYSCGSFWLFDTNNATYCPGGGIGMFGTVRLNAQGQVIDSGIRWPFANGILRDTDIGLFV